MQQNENTKYSHAFENNLQLSKERGTSRHAVIWKKRNVSTGTSVQYTVDRIVN